MNLKCKYWPDTFVIFSENYPYFRAEDDRWKNSVRHNLSMNPHFRLVTGTQSPNIFNLWSVCRKGTKSKHGAGHVWVLASETEGEGEGSYDRVGRHKVKLQDVSWDYTKYCVSRPDSILSNLSVTRPRQLKLSGKFWAKATNLSRWQGQHQLVSTVTVNLHLTNHILTSRTTRLPMTSRDQLRRYSQE